MIGMSIGLSFAVAMVVGPLLTRALASPGCSGPLPAWRWSAC